MDNYDFIERRIRFLRWVFSKEEPWRKYKKLGKELIVLFNHELTVDRDLGKHITENIAPIYSGSANSNYPYPPNTIQTLLQLTTTVNSSASASSITYNYAFQT